MAGPAGFARALDDGSVARTADDRPSSRRKREHVVAIESAKAPAMLRYQESCRGGHRHDRVLSAYERGRTASGRDA